ncbi:NifB/NifX family molybdenum-iron cluster-binding protein [Psychromonas antarctica]|jgi:predicted Fe-Mo cluster-binding NifX family protein|uniref:NifB/NifX family molybdenum-iron cluster-binding protein n=1 Tax=Psychromonas antarctica TaxID=67573 RepID=UPI001EE85B7E|nr:NifB/NifX family molybdenum-iron cluster-binding protein [Psychromonas antarctica]MCG6200510.1 NifB/NifX family molybdenum-iron cluster-binding protein [Psychromonas antarctica]
MKIAISTAGNNLDAQVELRFGRASSFLLFDTDTRNFSMLDNSEQVNAMQGAGIKTAQNIVTAGADVLISGHCGPKAMQVLNAKNIAVYVTEKNVIGTAIANLQNGLLEQITTHDVAGH